MSQGLYSGVSGLAIGVGLYKGTSSLWSGASGLITGSGGATLSLDFLNTSTLDSRITFSRGSNATLVDSTGKVTYAPNNLLTYSQEFENAAWTKTNATVTANSATAPDGTSTADSLIENTVNGVHDARRSVTASALTTYTQSIFVKASGRTRGQMQMFGNSGGSTINYDLTAGTATAAGTYGGWTGASATITNYGNGWYRITNTATTNAGLTTLVAAYLLADASGSASYTGDGTSGMFYWGAQVEVVTYQTTPSTYNSTSPKNLLGYTQEFDNAAWTKSLLSVTANTATAPDGTLSADKLIADTTAAVHTIGQNISVVSGTTMTGSVYAKAGEYNFAAVLLLTTFAAPQIVICNLSTGTISSTSGSPIATSITAVGNGWYRISITQVTNATGTATMQVRPTNVGNTTFFTGDGTSGIYVWGAQLSNSASLDPYVYNPGAAPTSTAYYGPRFDYDPVTLQPKGLLIEEQRTNLLTYSAQFDNAAWLKSNVAVTANTTVAPDGTTTGDTVAGITAGASNFLSRSITASATQYVYSIWVMAGTATSCALLLRDVTAATNLAATGQIISGPGSISGTSIITVSGLSTTQWTRIVLTLNAAATAGNTLQAYFYPETATSAATTAKSNVVWGAQLEAGAFATSYIPTVASTVTRSADVASMTGTNFSSWYNQSEGTIFASVDTVAPTGSPVLSFQDGAGASTNRHQMNIYSSFAATVVSSVTQSNIGTNTNTSPKLVYAYKANDFAACANGAAVAVDTSGTVPTTLAYATLGKWDFGSAASLNGHLRAITYYPQRLPNDQLRALTA